jgi:hypothetical protein
MRQIDRFAELIAEHVDSYDVAAGRAPALDPGGNCAAAARVLGLRNPTRDGNCLLQRLRRDLGWQAR